MQDARSPVLRPARSAALLLLALAASLLPACANSAARSGAAASTEDLSTLSEAARLERADALLRTTPLIDGHNDTPWQYRERVNNQLSEMDFASDLSELDPPMHTDLPRLRAGGVGGQFWSVYIPASRGGSRPGDARVLFEQIDFVHRLIAAFPEDLELASTADDIVRIHRNGRIASLMGIEGGHSIEQSLAVLRAAYDAGVRYMTLTHSLTTRWADSGTDDEVHDGLTPFGEEVVREMNRLGMLVDLSHVSDRTMHEALDISEAPVIFSHSSTRSLADTPRNVPDDVLRRLRDNGGVIMITFVPIYVSQPLLDWWDD
ncbi:MAG: dipeptidase, partial [Planctomycetota bacterium]|nr:dipeptidase [Planctomycetota bacterium]